MRPAHRAVWVVLQCLFSLAASVSFADEAKGPWEWVRAENGVAVHRRAVPGSALHEFRGAGTIYAPIAVLLGVLNDTEHRTEWMKEAAAQVLIQQVDPKTVLFYGRTKAPWPVSDRDAVMKATTTFDTAAKQVRIEIVGVEHPSWPPQKGVVRMPFLRGHWHFSPENNGKSTRAEYQVHADPGGSLPDWLINLVSKSIPYNTIVGLRQQVKRRRYMEFERRIEALPEYQTIVGGGMQPAAPTPTPTPAPAPSSPAALPVAPPPAPRG